jgi:HSP20 family protein
MNLARWTPFRDVNLLQNQMNRLFDEALQGWPETKSATAWSPVADIYETDNDLVVTMDLPGIDPKQVDLRVENNVLTIRGDREFAKNVETENFHRVERNYGTFFRSFTLASTVNAEKINAVYKDGVLSITLPKAEQAKPRKIQIASSSAASVAA